MQPSLSIPVAIALRHRDWAQIGPFIQYRYQPSSPDYKRTLTRHELTDKLSPSEPEYQDIVDFLTSHGFTISKVHDTRLIVDATGTVGAIESAFQVQMNEYLWNGVSFFAPAGDLVLPEHLACVVRAVIGLCNLSVFPSLPPFQR